MSKIFAYLYRIIVNNISVLMIYKCYVLMQNTNVAVNMLSEFERRVVLFCFSI